MRAISRYGKRWHNAVSRWGNFLDTDPALRDPAIAAFTLNPVDPNVATIDGGSSYNPGGSVQYTYAPSGYSSNNAVPSNAQEILIHKQEARWAADQAKLKAEQAAAVAQQLKAESAAADKVATEANKLVTDYVKTSKSGTIQSGMSPVYIAGSVIIIGALALIFNK
jgi:hypothetical protein